MPASPPSRQRKAGAGATNVRRFVTFEKPPVMAIYEASPAPRCWFPAGNNPDVSIFALLPLRFVARDDQNGNCSVEVAVHHVLPELLISPPFLCRPECAWRDRSHC